MAYEINNNDGTTLIVLEDGQIDNFTTSITFVGKNVVNYGEYQNENFLKLLENFANIQAPANPIKGQTWYNSSATSRRLSVYNGTSWEQLPSLVYAPTVASNAQAPGGFYWDSVNKALYVKSSTSSYSIVGGPTVAAYSANKLTIPVSINGTLFDGSTSTVISSTTTNTLSIGNYLTGRNFNGSSATTWAVDVGTVTSADAYKVVARDNAGDIWFNVGHGTATASRYADLAEKYLADQDYEPGTVIRVGGEKEVTAGASNKKAIGVVSTNPGYMMNSELVDGKYIALKGRVPVKVRGPINKSDELIPGDNGYAVKGTAENAHLVFAVALESIEQDGLIEAVVL